MLKGKRRKGLAVPASPRFLARVVEGQELLERAAQESRSSW
jgi:hypothetical protein